MSNVYKLVSNVCQHKEHPNPRQIAKWLLEGFSDRSELWLINSSAPVNINIYPCQEQLQQVLKTGLVVSKGVGKDQYCLLPTLKMKKYLIKFKDTLRGKVLNHDKQIQDHDKQIQGHDKRIQNLENAIRNMINKFDPPFTEEKYQQYTQE